MYLIINHILMNGVGYVPRILFEDRFIGTTLSLLVAIITSFLFLIWILRLFSHFPHQGLPEIMLHLPRWFRIPYLLYLTLFSTLAGSTTLLVLTDVGTRYLNTESSEYTTITLFLLFFFTFIHLPSEKILFGIEISTLLILPVVLLNLYIALTNRELLWDSILVVAKHLSAPTWSSFNAGNYLFAGFLYLIIFNRVLSLPRRQSRWVYTLPILFIFSILVIYFLPIGLLGSNAVSHYPYPWVATADTLRIPLGPTERMIFPFFFIYFIVAIISILLHWHVSLDLLRSFLGLNNLKKGSKLRYLPTLLILLLFFFIYIAYQRMHEFDFFLLEKGMINLFFPTELSLLLLLFFIRFKVRNGGL